MAERIHKGITSEIHHTRPEVLAVVGRVAPHRQRGEQYAACEERVRKRDRVVEPDEVRPSLAERRCALLEALRDDVYAVRTVDR